MGWAKGRIANGTRINGLHHCNAVWAWDKGDRRAGACYLSVDWKGLRHKGIWSGKVYLHAEQGEKFTEAQALFRGNISQNRQWSTSDITAYTCIRSSSSSWAVGDSSHPSGSGASIQRIRRTQTMGDHVESTRT
eukprot:scaffold179930_cov20-Tisochrysis_lutea.AAC.2